MGGNRINLLYSRKIAPYVLVSPFIISFLLFFLYPVYSTVIMSFQEVLPGQTHFIGLQNYKNLWDPNFLKAIKNSTIYTFFTIAVLIPFPLVMAVILNSKIMKLKNLFRAATFIPALTSIVVAGTIFRLMFGGLEGSLMNQFVGFFGIGKQEWLGHSWLAMLTLVVLGTWRWMGVNLLYFMAGLQGIPKDVYESADIDGASVWDKFSKLTVPMLKPIIVYVFTISIYGGYAMFVESYMLWNGNRSPDNVGLTIVGYLYRTGIEHNELGFGSAVGIALLVITFIITLVQLNLLGMFKKED